MKSVLGNIESELAVCLISMTVKWVDFWECRWQ